MNLKEAFTYQNFLNDLMASCELHLADPGILSTKTERHLRTKAYAGAEDETIIASRPDPDYDPDKLLAMMVDLADARFALSKAIEDAKRKQPMDLDAALEHNKARQKVCSRIKLMLKARRRVGKIQSTGFKFNETGEQVRYCYDVETEETPRFDADAAKALLERLGRQCRETSAAIDQIMVTAAIDPRIFTPPYDIDKLPEDIMARCLSDKQD